MQAHIFLDLTPHLAYVERVPPLKQHWVTARNMEAPIILDKEDFNAESLC